MNRYNFNHLVISWGVSRGRDTYGYNICRLDDRQSGKRYRTCGGGYDMIGTVFGDWLEDVYQSELLAKVQELMSNPDAFEDCGYSVKGYIKFSGLYGMTYNTNNGKVSLDGACGISSVIQIAEALGLQVQWEGNKKGHTVGYYVTRDNITAALAA